MLATLLVHIPLREEEPALAGVGLTDLELGTDLQEHSGESLGVYCSPLHPKSHPLNNLLLAVPLCSLFSPGNGLQACLS